VKTPRRRFLQTLAVTPLATPALGRDQAAPAPAPVAPPPAPPTGDDVVAEALTEAVKRQYGAYLDAEDLVAIRQEIGRSLESAGRLHAVSRLESADGPVNLFVARLPEPPGKRGRR
jgi:hypothetical protein